MGMQGGSKSDRVVCRHALVLDVKASLPGLKTCPKWEAYTHPRQGSVGGGHIRGSTGDFLIPLLKMSSAILKPSGTPPMFLEKLGSPFFLTLKASKTQWTPR